MVISIFYCNVTVILFINFGIRLFTVLRFKLADVLQKYKNFRKRGNIIVILFFNFCRNELMKSCF